MEKQEAIVHRRGVPTTGGTRSLDEDIRIISATLWPTAAEPTTATVSAADAVEASLLPPSTRLVREFPVAGLDRDYVRHLEQRIVRSGEVDNSIRYPDAKSLCGSRHARSRNKQIERRIKGSIETNLSRMLTRRYASRGTRFECEIEFDRREQSED